MTKTFDGLAQQQKGPLKKSESEWEGERKRERERGWGGVEGGWKLMKKTAGCEEREREEKTMIHCMRSFGSNGKI